MEDSNNPITLSDDGKVRIERVLVRAANDIDFRERLIRDPREALNDSDLPPEEIEAICTLQRVGLEELGVNIRAMRGFLRDNGNSAPALNYAIQVAAAESSVGIPQLTEQEKERIEGVLRKAAGDVAFREALFSNTRVTLAAEGLSESEITAVERLNRVGMEELGINIRPFRAFMRDNGNSSPMAFAIGSVAKTKE